MEHSPNYCYFKENLLCEKFISRYNAKNSTMLPFNARPAIKDVWYLLYLIKISQKIDKKVDKNVTQVVTVQEMLRDDINAPRVLGYQLHPRCSPRRENVIRINNSNSLLPLFFPFNSHTHNSTLTASVRPTFPDGAIILGSIVSRFLAHPNFSHPSSLVLRLVAERHEGRAQVFTNFTNTRARLRCFKNSDNVSLLLDREEFYSQFFMIF